LWYSSLQPQDDDQSIHGLGIVEKPLSVSKIPIENNPEEKDVVSVQTKDCFNNTLWMERAL